MKLTGVIGRELNCDRKLRAVGEREGSGTCNNRERSASRADVAGDRAAGGDKIEGYPSGLAYRAEVERF